MTALHVDLPAPLKLRLEKEAMRRGVSQRVVVVLALEGYLGNRERVVTESGILTGIPPETTPEDVPENSA